MVRHGWVLGIATVVAALFTPIPASACGGFFCDSPPDNPDLPRPVYQTGELVLFVKNGADVEAHIQIQYEGEAQDFSWVLPVHVVPEIDFGSDDAFFALQAATAPSYTVRPRADECPFCNECPSWGDSGDADADADTDADADADADGDMDTGGGGVDIVDSGIVGPFETVTLSSDDATALTTWLTTNGYVVPETAYPIIDAYVSAGFYFVGLKLTKEAEVGDIRPLVLRMPGSNLTPCVPLRLTAIAAAQDMPVSVWVLGDSRAVSTNYQEVVPNDLLLTFGTEPYETVVSRAIDEVGGRGFVTEYAGSPSDFTTAIDASQFDTAALASLTDPVAFLNAMIAQGFIESRLVLELLRQFIPKPASVTVDDETFYECLECGGGYYGYYDAGCTECYEDDIAGQPFDPVGFAAALEEAIVRPMRDLSVRARGLSTLTALHSSISPGEMLEDPEFAFRPDLPQVARERVATQTQHCQGSINGGDDYYETDTAEGLKGMWSSVSPPALSGQPAAVRSYLRDGSGDELVLDETDTVLAAADSFDVPRPISVANDRYCECGRSDGRSQSTNPESPAYESGGLCTATPAAGGAGASAAIGAVIAALALALRRRRTP